MLFDEDYSKAVGKYLSLRGPTRKRAKTMCKKTGHRFVDVVRKILVWPFLITQRRVCERCGKTASIKKVSVS